MTVLWARRIHLVLAWAFLGAVIVQFFLIGLYLFNGSDIALHREWGYDIGLIVFALVIAAGVGRLPRRMIGWDLLLLVVYFVQTVLPVVGVPLIEALHPVNALLVFSLSLLVAWRARSYVPGPLGTAPVAPAAPLGTEPVAAPERVSPA